MKFPEYVWMGIPSYRCAMILHASNGKQATYFRVAGRWSIDAKYIKGKLYTCNAPKDVHWLNGKLMVECTEEEWKKDNEGYV